ncbi:hypothetical protein L3Q82_000416 [Scortum barcoo]|uniref:Uncharacterized protein n=1 Tax=Scortum barcoo TaxID=214431 RepID=A0ACB8XAU3_9TELE|nr:hypothetical protein L3Q82_000416 [Scortum barcoo]
MDSRILCSFYRCTIESILTGCITAWYSSCTTLNRKALQRVVKAAQHITRTEMPSMEDLYTQQCRRKATKIIKDPSHPSYKLFCLLPSGRRPDMIRTRSHSLWGGRWELGTGPVMFPELYEFSGAGKRNVDEEDLDPSDAGARQQRLAHMGQRLAQSPPPASGESHIMEHNSPV